MGKLLWVFLVIVSFNGKWANGFGMTEVELLHARAVTEANDGYGGSLDSNDTLMVPLTLTRDADVLGAVCLDGTLPAYRLHRGHGSGANNWLIHLQGGAWCNNNSSCVERTTTMLGSSKYMEKETPFTGILSNKPSENPDFFNWNRVFIRFCDGASFSGDGENKAAKLQFRGQRIWKIAMQALMVKGMIGAKKIQNCVAPPSADPHNKWSECRENLTKCSKIQIQYLNVFRLGMLNAVLLSGFSESRQNGYFINSCFVHCQVEDKDTWYSNDSPVISNKKIATAVGEWYFGRSQVRLIDCRYPCASSCPKSGFKTSQVFQPYNLVNK